jgi:hypothetical protein
MDQVTVDLHTDRDQPASYPAVKACGMGERLEAETLTFSDPREVLAHPALDTSAKRALLASWASDSPFRSRAVRASDGKSNPPGAAPHQCRIGFDAIGDASV